ncbi:unnamed protein product [Cyclocybe aegerita]|uniref:DUF6534 domain-containing protein n=1 Tax=Cyclocybe aegerita TaxID=1973307 RepID=A0A8S0VYD7_CYCAE|nr:unnamed protein product [Cyclocybe aegerita]
MSLSGLIPALDNSFGAIFIGMVIAGGLWGITTAQTYWYYTTYPKDPLGWKLLVAVVWALDTVHQALISSLFWIAKAATRISITDANNRYHTLVQYAQGSAMAGDILLAGTMLYAINTGAVTSLCAILTLMCVLAFPGTYIYGAFYFCVGRLYVNSMLASLNARKPLMKNATFLEMSVTGDSSGHSHSKSQTHGEIGKKSFNQATTYEEPKLGVYVNTTKSTVLDIA